MKRLSACLALVAVACGGDSRPGPLLNTCRESFECSSDEECDAQLGVCVRPRSMRSYSYYLEVLTERDGRGLVARTRSPTLILAGSGEVGSVLVRRSARVSGAIADPSAAGSSVRAELAFFAEDAPPYASDLISVFTRVVARQHLYEVELDPSATYRARIIPLGPQAAKLPPLWTAGNFKASAGSAPLTYPEVRTVRGTIRTESWDSNRDSPSPLSGLHARMRDKETGVVTSSFATLDSDGAFELTLEPRVRDALASQELVLDVLPDGPPWSVTIAVDGSQLQPDPRAPEGLLRELVVPDIPEFEEFRLRVFVGKQQPIGALVTMTSSFDAPPGSKVEEDRDWCRLRSQSELTFRCAGRFTLEIAPGGTTVSVLPGYYETSALPRGEAHIASRYDAMPLDIRIQDMLPAQGPYAITLEEGGVYRGVVRGPDGKPMPLVTVMAQPLGLRGYTQNESVNDRVFQTETNRDGSYELAVEIGGFDLLAVPPEGTGFPVYLQPNRYVPDNRPGHYDLEIKTPVVAQGTVVDEQNDPVYPARVEAFALVEGESGMRSVRVAAANSNDAGTFTLLMPPELADDTIVPTMDGGVDLDGGIRRSLVADGGVSDSAPRGSRK